MFFLKSALLLGILCLLNWNQSGSNLVSGQDELEPFECGPDEHVDRRRVPGCEPRCNYWNPDCHATIDRTPKCFCSRPKLRDGKTGKCVLESQCSPISSRRNSVSTVSRSDLKCGPDEFVDKIRHKLCEPTCEYPVPICRAMLVDTPKCLCSRPKVRDKTTGRCVFKSECSTASKRRYSGRLTPPSSFKCRTDE